MKDWQEVAYGVGCFVRCHVVWLIWIPCPHIKRCHWFFYNNFYKYGQIFVIFGTQLCKWLLIILVNLLRRVPCTSLTWWRNVDVTEIMPFTVHVTQSSCCRERRQEFIPPEMAIQFARFESGGLQHTAYPSREGLPFADPWCERVENLKERLLSEWRLMDHTIIVAAIAQWCSRLNVCRPIRVNSGHFEHKFWASDFLLCFVCFIDTGSPKCDRYKHVCAKC